MRLNKLKEDGEMEKMLSMVEEELNPILSEIMSVVEQRKQESIVITEVEAVVMEVT